MHGHVANLLRSQVSERIYVKRMRYSDEYTDDNIIHRSRENYRAFVTVDTLAILLMGRDRIHIHVHGSL